MVRLTNLLITEGKGDYTLVINNPNSTGSKDKFIQIEFKKGVLRTTLTLIPRSGKELDKIYDNELEESDIEEKLLKQLNGANKLTNIEWEVDMSYGGAGYGFNIDLEKITKKLR